MARVLGMLILIAGGLQCLLATADEPTRDGKPLPDTAPLTLEGDIAAQLVAGADRFLLEKLDESLAERAEYWDRDFTSPAAYNASIASNRARLAHILGVRDKRSSEPRLELIAAGPEEWPMAHGDGYRVFRSSSRRRAVLRENCRVNLVPHPAG